MVGILVIDRSGADCVVGPELLKTDYLNGQSPPSFIIESHNGQLTLMDGLPPRVKWGLLSRKTKFDPARSATAPVWGFGSSRTGSVFLLFLPHWYVVLLTTVLAALPWIFQVRYRFSIRTLLIATTLVAVVLGLAVYFAK